MRIKKGPLLAQKGIEINQPADIIRDEIPMCSEFLGVLRTSFIYWKAIWKSFVTDRKFLELDGVMFVGTQQRATLNNTTTMWTWYFYNKILRAYVLIELKEPL